jgi:hypothetical protein
MRLYKAKAANSGQLPSGAHCFYVVAESIRDALEMAEDSVREDYDERLYSSLRVIGVEEEPGHLKLPESR